MTVASTYHRAGRYVGWSISTASEHTPANGSVQVIVAGWWVRFIWGLTFKPDRFRWRCFDGHCLLAVRLWPFTNAMDGRLVGVQWKRNSARFTVDGRRALA